MYIYESKLEFNFYFWQTLNIDFSCIEAKATELVKNGRKVVIKM